MKGVEYLKVLITYIVCLIVIGSALDKLLGVTLKLVKSKCHLNRRKFSFALRTVDIWNGFVESKIACDSWF